MMGRFDLRILAMGHLLLICSSYAVPQSDTSGLTDIFQMGGYVKYLFSATNTPAIGRVNDHLLHARLNGKFFFSEELRGDVEIRNRIYYGGSVSNSPDFLTSIRADHDLPNADVVWWNNGSSVGYSELDRLWLDATLGRFQCTIGRQRIAWGTALVWNPTDLFNPLSVLDFDYEERPGVDAIHMQYFSSAVSKVELAIKPGKNRLRRVVAGKILINRWAYDFHFLGGEQGGYPFAGLAWAGDIAGGGFRGELISKKISDETVTLFPSLHNTWSTSVALSGDYTFPSDTYIHTEVLYNNRGTPGSAAGDLLRSQMLGLLSSARWSLYQELSFDLHPLVRATAFVIYNPDDHSSVWVPSLAWSVVENVDISFFGLLFEGKSGTEYGDFGQSLFLRGKYSF